MVSTASKLNDSIWPPSITTAVSEDMDPYLNAELDRNLKDSFKKIENLFDNCEKLYSKGLKGASGKEKDQGESE